MTELLSIINSIGGIVNELDVLLEYVTHFVYAEVVMVVYEGSLMRIVKMKISRRIGSKGFTGDGDLGSRFTTRSKAITLNIYIYHAECNIDYVTVVWPPVRFKGFIGAIHPA